MCVELLGAAIYLKFASEAGLANILGSWLLTTRHYDTDLTRGREW